MKPKFVEVEEIQQGIDRLTSMILPHKTIPPQIFCMFNRRKIFKPSIVKIVSERTSNYNETIVNNILAKEANRRFYQETHPKVHVLRNIISLLKKHLRPDKKSYVDEVDKYIEKNGLPDRLTYDVIDFIQATGDKFKNLSPSQLLNQIGTHYKIKINAASAGSAPKLGNTLFGTLPTLFSQLFFDIIENTGIVLSDSKLESFEEHLIHLYNNEIRKTTNLLLHSQNGKKLDDIIENLQNKINNNLWVPKQIKAKVKQMELYFINRGFIKPALFRFLAHSYLKWESDHGMKENAIKDLSISDVIFGIKSGLENTLRNAKKRVRSGWTIFESAPQKDSYMYNELVEILRELGGKVKQADNTRAAIKTYKKCIMKRFALVPRSEILYRQATS